MLLLVLGFVGLSLGAEICSPPCGCFQDNYPFNDRALPETWQTQDLEFRLYTPNNPNSGVDISWNNIAPQWSSSRPTIFVIHGWNSNPGTFAGIRGGFFARNHNINLITVDWNRGAGHLWYPQSASNTRVVGACTEHLAQALVNAGTNWGVLHCIGHSLGAQACGYMGKSTNGQLGRISGLDPAGPWFDEINDNRVHLHWSDTQFMDNIHTNAGDLGMERATGDVDFYPNNGRWQPPCGPEEGACDHGICKDYYERSIRSSSSSCRFWSRPCASEADANAGRCNPAGCSGSPCGRMGYYATETFAGGRHYLTTTASSPYCQS